MEFDLTVVCTSALNSVVVFSDFVPAGKRLDLKHIIGDEMRTENLSRSLHRSCTIMPCFLNVASAEENAFKTGCSTAEDMSI